MPFIVHLQGCSAGLARWLGFLGVLLGPVNQASWGRACFVLRPRVCRLPGGALQPCVSPGLATSSRWKIHLRKIALPLQSRRTTCFSGFFTITRAPTGVGVSTADDTRITGYPQLWPVGSVTTDTSPQAHLSSDLLPGCRWVLGKVPSEGRGMNILLMADHVLGTVLRTLSS